MRYATLCLIVAALLAGCGQKGPLRIPEQPPAADTAQQPEEKPQQP